MNGIYGIVGPAGLDEVAAMGHRLVHRGRFGGEWSVAPTVQFGQRARNPAAEGFTPPALPVVLDGFLDNRLELTQLLGKSGTEVCDDASLVYALYLRHGVEVFGLLRGQFGIAIYDAAQRALVLARDRWGTRSVYYVRYHGCLVFASEYKALLTFRDLPAAPNLQAIQYVHCTLHGHPSACFLAGVEVVPSGSWVAFNDTGVRSRRFWSIAINIASYGRERHAAAVREAFLNALREQTADKPTIGVALSGGLDSALVVAGLHQVAGDKPIHTFTAGFGKGDPEMAGATQVARFFGTIHHEILMPPEELAAVLRPLVWHMEDTVGHEETAYLYVTAREATKHVDTMFSGRKADMLFAGMPRHKLIKLGIMLPPVRPVLREFYNFTQSGRSPQSALGRALVAAYYKGEVIAPAHVIGVPDYPPPDPLPLAGAQPLNEKLRRDVFDEPVTMTATERLHSAFALHSNSPFMDYRMFGTAFSIPDRLKIHGLKQKYILRLACRGLLPQHVLHRGKSLQRLKHDRVLSDVLAQLADDLLSPAAVAARGFFPPEYVVRARRRRSGEAFSSMQIYRLWSMLLAELWGRLFLDARGAPIAEPHDSLG